MIEDIQKVTEIALEMIDAANAQLDKMMPSAGPGAHRPQRMELAEWAAQAAAISPPTLWIRPDGTPVMASTYLLAVGECEGGKALLKRIQEMQEETF